MRPAHPPSCASMSCRHIPTTYQSDAGSAGIFSKRPVTSPWAGVNSGKGSGSSHLQEAPGPGPEGRALGEDAPERVVIVHSGVECAYPGEASPPEAHSLAHRASAILPSHERHQLVHHLEGGGQEGVRRCSRRIVRPSVASARAPPGGR
eukprot:1184574-Prorocentrum_minimum.AAC.1